MLVPSFLARRCLCLTTAQTQPVAPQVPRAVEVGAATSLIAIRISGKIERNFKYLSRLNGCTCGAQSWHTARSPQYLSKIFESVFYDSSFSLKSKKTSKSSFCSFVEKRCERFLIFFHRRVFYPSLQTLVARFSQFPDFF